MGPAKFVSPAKVPPPPPPTTPVHPQLPTGMAIIGTSTFGTILAAPPSPVDDVTSSRPTYRNEYEWYAQENGISVEEARRRTAEQQQVMPIFERLQARLSKDEPTNYVGARMVHKPDWGYLLYFKHDPETTLRNYSVHPRFKAVQGGMTQAELEAIVQPWSERFTEAGILNGYAINTLEGRMEMMTGLTRAEYEALAAARGWGPLPEQVFMAFAPGLDVPRVDPRVTGFLRGFASENRATTLQLAAGYSGQAILDDGCLRLKQKDGSKGPLLVFHKETGIGLDAQGYVAIIDRQTGKAMGRIGEMWSWAGPNDATHFDGLAELKAACGDGPIINVGNPESLARFKARYPGT
nr:hypothetical protein [uncultured Sphingomonas sp.]